MSTIELSHLKTFCAVVEHRSFTKAGEVVNRTQSTVSSQIGHLEKAYGETLLTRHPRDVVPTESGRILYEYAVKILKLLDESAERIGELKQVVKGNLVIGASTIPGTYIVPHILNGFRTRYPDVAVTLTISNSRSVLKAIAEHDLEIGAVGEMIEDRRLEYTALAEDRLVLIVPPDHPWTQRGTVPLDELRNEKFICREHGSGTRDTLESALRERGIKRLPVVMELGSTEAVKQGVLAGLGLSFVSEWAVRDGQVPVVGVEDFDVTRRFYLVRHRSGPRRYVVDRFMDFVQSA